MIHFGGLRGTDYRSHMCNVDTSDKEVVRLFKTESDKVKIKAAEERHKDCWRKNRHLRIAVLRTCRQIYLEAALIPWAENTFILGASDGDDFRLANFGRCIDILYPSQRKTIRSLVIQTTNSNFNIRNAEALAKLHKLVVLVEKDHSTFRDEYKDQKRAYYYRLRHLAKFAQLPLTSVDVCIFQPDTVPSKEMRKWSEILERKILPRHDEVTKYLERG